MILDRENRSDLCKMLFKKCQFCSEKNKDFAGKNIVFAPESLFFSPLTMGGGKTKNSDRIYPVFPFSGYEIS